MALVDANIVPSKDLNRNKEMFINFFCIISRAAAIEQFRNGVKSISREIIVRNCCFKSFFVYEKPIIKLKDLLKFLSYTRSAGKGTRAFVQEDQAVNEFELFLIQMDTKELPSLSDFLGFVVGVDRVPLQGFGKNIDIYFEDSDNLRTASTCGLFMTVPYNITAEKLNFCVLNGGTFGKS